jgi:hypothetical protein
MVVVVLLRELSLENHKFFWDVVGPEAKNVHVSPIASTLEALCFCDTSLRLGLALFNLSFSLCGFYR